MSVVRVHDIPAKCTDRELKIYFSKPENNGGPIDEIYYPLFNNDAVIVFRDSETAKRVMAKNELQLRGENIYVKLLPSIKAFTIIEATLEPSVAALIQATDEIKDEIQYEMDVDFYYNETDCLTGVRGNWYMLECLWARVDKISRRQGRARRRFKSQTQTQGKENSSQPMEVDDKMISMPSFSDKAVATEGDVSDEEKTLKYMHPESKIKTSKTDIKSVKEKEFGKEDYQEKEEKQKELDKSIEQLSALDLTESEGSESEHTESKVEKSEIVIINTKPDDVRSLDFRYGQLKVSVYTGWITMAETDAIVNAANSSLAHYGGVADAIAKAAGREMERQCEDYIRKYRYVPTTKVMHTCAGGEISENVKYIIHAVGPMWTSISEMERKCAKELTQTFLNCMVYGNDVLKLQSITMPVISSGVFGCPLEICVRSFLNAVLVFGSEHMFDSVHLNEIHLVNNNSDNTVMTVMQLRDLVSQETQRLVLEANQQIQEEPDVYETMRDIKRRQGERLVIDRDTGYSEAPALDRTSVNSRDKDPYMSRSDERKSFDISIRIQDPISFSNSTKSPYLPSSSRILSGHHAVAYHPDDDNIDTRVRTEESWRLKGTSYGSSEQRTKGRALSPPPNKY